jgi:integrase
MATDKLTAMAVKRTKPGERPIRLFDGGGMYLEVQPTGARYWRHKYRFGGKEKLLSLGVYPEVSLTEARQRRQEARSLLAKGVDPSALRKAQKALPSALQNDSFEIVARMFLASRRAGWSEPHAKRWIERLEADVFPYLGSLKISTITAPMLLQTLRRVEARGVRETVHSINQAIGQVLRFGVGEGYCERDLTADIRGNLKPVLVKNMAAITAPAEFALLLRAIDDYRGAPVTRAALALSALLFQRPGNVRAMKWADLQLDGDAPTWTISAAEMKQTRTGKENGRPHIVPLAKQAVAILVELHPLTGHGTYCFPSLHGQGRCMSENTANVALRRLGFDKETHTAHGFRASARTIMVERLGMEPELIEAQLAHGKSGPLGEAYDRAQYVEQRRTMMQTWADYLDRLRAGAKLTPSRAA